MIAFDTNVLLRLLLNDDARQSGQAQALVDQAVFRSDKVLLPDIVLCEMEWVLSSVYKVPKAAIIETLRRKRPVNGVIAKRGEGSLGVELRTGRRG